MTEPLLLAIDGGQTSTKAMVATVDGTILGSGAGNPTVHYLSEGGVDKNRVAVQGAMRAALAESGADGAQVVAVGMGSTGVDPLGEEIPAIHDIIHEIAPDATIAVVTDTYTNLMGASGGEPGVVVIAGGGAIGFGITADGQTAVSNGFGYWIGDEGSAFWIGMRAIDVACRASDRRDRPTALEQIVLEHFGLEVMRKLPRIVYRAGFERQEISFLAPKVAAVARQGDPSAIAIYRQAAHELALTAAGVLRQLHQPGDRAIVYPTGGVFANDDLMRAPFEAHLADLWPSADVRSPRFPPLVGGLIVAARLAGRGVNEAWLGRVGESLR
ncbi:MAG: hypothetical protein KF883_02605 [Thermomicrobiales bacterium]|nr:hypothetical protein [Thermomicrobiales bacterium]